MLLSCQGNIHRGSGNEVGNTDTVQPIDTIKEQTKYPTKIDTLKYNLRLHPAGNYNTLARTIQQQRAAFAQQYSAFSDSSLKDSILLTAGEYLKEAIINQLLPFWYGTPWDFNGYTHIPNQGKIACGYLVSTTLLHCGFHVDRYHLAKQDPFSEAEIIQGDSAGVRNIQPELGLLTVSAEDYNQKTMEKIKSKIDTGLYFVGLDCHVGYLLYRKNRLIFLHSNYYLPNEGVMAEFASVSGPFTNSMNYYIASISNNTELIKKWLVYEKLN